MISPQTVTLNLNSEVTIRVLHIFAFLLNTFLFHFYGGSLSSFAHRRNHKGAGIVLAVWAGRVYL